jgi:hypothetical protein
MSYVVAAPELMTSAATDLATIGANLSAAHTAAAASTVAVLPAAADEVSVRIAHLFSQHARDYHALAGKAVASQHHFAHNLKASAASYASAEAANTSLLQPLDVIGSIGSAIGGLWDQLVNLVNAVVGQVNTLLTGFQNMLSTLLTNLLTFLGDILGVAGFFLIFGVFPLVILLLVTPFLIIGSLPQILAQLLGSLHL